MAEQFGFQHLGRDGGAVDGDEQGFVAGRELVDGLGDQFLAGAGLADNQRCRLFRRDLINRLLDPADGFALADQMLAAGRDLFAQELVLDLEAADRQRAIDGDLQGFQIERSQDVVGGAKFHGGDGRRDLALCGDDDDRYLQSVFTHGFQ